MRAVCSLPLRGDTAIVDVEQPGPIIPATFTVLYKVWLIKDTAAFVLILQPLSPWRRLSVWSGSKSVLLLIISTANCSASIRLGPSVQEGWVPLGSG